MDLKMEVYTPGLELLGILEIFDSIIWDERAFSAGTFSLSSLIGEESRRLLAADNIIWITGTTAGIIEHVEEVIGDEGPYITVKGRLLSGLLDRRILWGTYNLYGEAPALMCELVTDCAITPTRGDDTSARIIPGLAISGETPTTGSNIRKQKTGGSLLDALEELGEANMVAFGVRFKPQVPQMEFWARPGVDRTVRQAVNEPVFFSTELDDVLSSEYSYDSSEEKNVSLVAGSGEGEDRIYVTVDSGGVADIDDPSGGSPSALAPATKADIASSIQSAIYDSWEASY